MSHSLLEVASRPIVASPRLKVIAADDDLDMREALAAAVEGFGLSCLLARDGLEAWEMHLANRADIILSDWKMPRMSGIDLCRKVRASDLPNAYTHFIFVTGNDDKAHLVEGMHAGADDYIAKPLDLDELEVRLEAARRVVTLNRELRENNNLLRRDSERSFAAARTDALTCASNRLALGEDLQALAARVARYRHRYCAALSDVDEFKAYNDHFGHLAGDEALRRVARAIHGGLRRGDSFYRFGGEEFLVILPEQTLAEAAAGMGRIRQEVENLKIPHAPSAGRPFLTISTGISALGSESSSSFDTWLERSDLALYSAKALGRNRVEIESAPGLARSVGGGGA
jgi:diguanylate cyclase (GGDEF)-like protein